jgi:hypothetical protein
VGKPFTRRFDRYRTEIPVVIKVLGEDGYVRIHGRCFEIAEAGLGAVITSTLAAGEISKPCRKPIRCRTTARSETLAETAGIENSTTTSSLALLPSNASKSAHSARNCPRRESYG